MGSSSEIEWTDATWNPVAGCAILSPGCSNCYAMRMAARLEAMNQSKYKGLTRKSGRRSVWTGKVSLDWSSLNTPAKWAKGRRVFVNSMSDLFHEDVPIEFIKAVFGKMEENNHHIFQILTKRIERLKNLSTLLPWTQNIWMGVSVESDKYLYRIEELKATNAKIKFLSLEPLLGPLSSLNLSGIDWVIVGGESGPGARPMDPAWVRDIRDQCLKANVPFHFKQWGGPVKSINGRILDGITWDEQPEAA